MFWRVERLLKLELNSWSNLVMLLCSSPNGRKVNNKNPFNWSLLESQIIILTCWYVKDNRLLYSEYCNVCGTGPAAKKLHYGLQTFFLKHNFMHTVHKATSPCMSPIFWRRIRINQYFLLTYNKQLNQTIM